MRETVRTSSADRSMACASLLTSYRPASAPGPCPSPGSCGETAGEDEPDNGYFCLGLQPQPSFPLKELLVSGLLWVGGTDRMNKQKRPRQ
ncbi:hypothetical protein GE21DRAFT_1340021 [Neurospora crassa]|nr:hypothetical protein GE21DRAFT_1340021 [Neurospora crassa]